MAAEDKYRAMQLTELKALIKKRHIKGTSTMRKPQLIQVLVESDSSNGVGAESEAEPKAKETSQDTAQSSAQSPYQERPQKRRRGRPRKSREPQPEQKPTETAEAVSEEPAAVAKEDAAAVPAGQTAAAKDTAEEKGENKSSIRNDFRGRENGQNNHYRSDGKHQHIRRNNNLRYEKDKEKDSLQPAEENTQPAAVVTNREAAREAAREQAEIPKYKDSHPCSGMLEVLPDGFGFLRSNGYGTGEDDVYVSPSQIRRFRLRTGDMLTGETRKNNPTDKYGALLFMDSVNGKNPDVNARRTPFEKLTPIFPNERIRLERDGGSHAVRLVDLVSPIGKGQRGMIVSQPKAGKTTLLKEVALSVMQNNPEIHLIILLIDERPEEVTDMKETIAKANPEGKSDVEVVASTFDETPENHKRISEMVIEHARRMVEDKKDVMILLDSITRLARAYNLTVPPSGRTLSGGLDPTALYMPKRFFGAARNMREGGSLTILATALVETGSRMDDVVFEEFKGTGNMELVLDRSLSERRVFPAIDLAKSSTRRDDMLLSREEMVAMNIIRKGLSGMKGEDAIETVLNLITRTKTNYEFCREIVRMRVL